MHKFLIIICKTAEEKRLAQAFVKEVTGIPQLVSHRDTFEAFPNVYVSDTSNCGYQETNDLGHPILSFSEIGKLPALIELRRKISFNGEDFLMTKEQIEKVSAYIKQIVY